MKLIAEPKPGDEIDATQTMYPSSLQVIAGDVALSDHTSTYFGYALRGTTRVCGANIDARLEPGGYFAIAGDARVVVDGLAVLIRRYGYRGMTSTGVIEDEGRLAYIDGCSDSVLVPPARAGDPVFNFLHFPPGIEQSVHSHPSIRLGVVARGRGAAFGPKRGGSAADQAEWTEPLNVGSVFLLEPHEMHAFRTTQSATAMDVIAYHPDSDWGPTDGVHPMLNRTYLK